ncbi:uncharacterized protein LOC123533841 [Mercenaria mercenaria]|uniref:uncharacterized protein LOC123533841 n=1 Tax=Mercenaria mercenaria TaxID=6596 RepID=UPI00234F215B|nr:uncharacterized protein LOC123533841 [Mercenaria mercenaria]
MPLCLVYTNMKRTDLDEKFEERMAKCIAEVTQLPLEYIYVTIHPESPTFCAGSRDPAMWCQIHCKKIFQDTANLQEYYKKFFETLKETTKLPGNRIVVELFDVPVALAQLGN